MGNQQRVSSNPENKKHLPKLQSIKSTDKKPQHTDHFFIQHIQNHKNEIDIQSFDQRRHVCISLIGLYQTWKRIPNASLYSALFILPLKKEWIFNYSKNKKNVQSNPLLKLSLFSDDEETREFIQLLKWKDSQRLVMFMGDYDHSENKSTDLINPFWYHLNDTFKSLWDPITNNNYKPINFDLKFWQNVKFNNNNTKTSDILKQFYFLTMKYNSLAEIINQSNPNSFYAIKSYPPTPSYINPLRSWYANDENQNACDQMNEHENEGDWFVGDYNPYDIDECNFNYESD